MEIQAVKRRRKAPPKTIQVAIFRRDLWLCCWCRKPVIFAPVMRLLELEVRASGHTGTLTYYHAHWTRDGAPLLDELGAVIDHVEAFVRGGSDEQQNLCTSCCKCNGRKSSRLLAEWDQRIKSKPIEGRYGEPLHWDGLSSLFLVLAERRKPELTEIEREWFDALLR